MKFSEIHGPHHADEIATRLCSFLRDNVMAPNVMVEPDTGLSEIGVDSFSLMEMVLFIERYYGLVLPPESLTPENIASVNALSQLCATLLSHNHPVPPLIKGGLGGI